MKKVQKSLKSLYMYSPPRMCLYNIYSEQAFVATSAGTLDVSDEAEDFRETWEIDPEDEKTLNW